MRGLFGTLAARTSEFKTTDISALTWSALLGGPNSRSGVTVSIDTALRVSAVLACARVLAEGIAQLPLKVYRVGSNGTKTTATDLAVYKILARRPNDWMTSFEFREMLMFHAVLTGNGYAYIGRGRGKILELIPLVPSCVSVTQSVDYGLTYTVTDKNGVIGTFPRESIFHLRGPSWNGYLGMDAVQLAREAIGLAIVTEQAHATLHANGSQPGGILVLKGKLGPEAKVRLKSQWDEAHSGVRNAFKTAVIDVDAEWKPLGMNGVDSQHLETRRYQVEEICRSLRVFPQMVGYSDKTATFASAESFFLAHVTHSLMPWATRWEHSIERDLLDNEDDLIAKFNFAALLRGDNASQASFYEKALGGARAETAYMTRNEVRALQELDPIEGGDVLPMPVAPIPVDPAPIGGPDNGPAKPAKPDAIKPPSIGTNARDMGDVETKTGRVLSGENEGKIVKARDHLNDVLATASPAIAPASPMTDAA